MVAQHLVAAGSLLEDDPERALEHARFARSKSSRLSVVREAVGLAAYRAGEWAEAIAELRAARRMGGGPGHLAVMADAERALGRPERALELARGPEARELGRAEAIELLIVASGARRDLGEPDAAVVSLQVPELDPSHHEPWSARLFYAYADALLDADRRDEAVRWFLHAAHADDEEETDAAERLAELTGDGDEPEDEPIDRDDGDDPDAEGLARDAGSGDAGSGDAEVAASEAPDGSSEPELASGAASDAATGSPAESAGDRDGSP